MIFQTSSVNTELNASSMQTLQIELEVSEYAKVRCERDLDCVKSPTHGL